MFSARPVRGASAPLTIAAALAAGVLVPAGSAAAEPGAAAAAEPPRPGVCTASPVGADVAVTGATANDEVTQAWRHFGNTGGGWENQGGWAAADGTYSTVAPDGDVVWLFNDTWLGPVNPDESLGDEPGLVNNSAVLAGSDGLPDVTVTGGTREAPTSLAGPLWQWNGDGIWDDGKLRVVEFEQGTSDDPPPWNFAWVGTTIATFNDDFSVDSVVEVPTTNSVQWGVELVPCGDTIYIYGTEGVPLDKHMHIARVPVDSLTDIARWEYYTGSGWSSDPAASARVARNVGASYSVTPIEGKWVLTTSDAILGDTIYVSVADSPIGPFDERQAVYVAPEAHSGDNLYAPYNIAAHPSISEPGVLTISYNVNSSVGFEGIRADANANRPRFVDVHLASVPDQTRPQVTLVAPTGELPTRELGIRIDATDDRGLQRIVANVYRGGQLVRSTQTAGEGATAATHTATVALPDGDYTIKYNAQDLAGNVSKTSTVAVTVDGTAPRITIKDGPSKPAGEAGVYERISVKLYDAGQIAGLTLNGVAKDLSDDVWSDLNHVEPGVFGAVAGENTLVVFDRAGNSRTLTFTLS